MTAPQSTPLPEAPQRNEPEEVFIPKSNAFVASLEPFRQEVQVQADYMNVQSDSALQSATMAAASEEMALSAGNFIGVWVDLTGTAAAGVSVAHLDQYWGSLNAIADITLSEPSISADWQAIGGELGTAAIKNVGTAEDQIPLNSDLPASAKSGDYNDLSNKPTLGTAASVDTGAAPENVPLNSDLGAASTKDTGTALGEVPLSEDLNMVGASENYTSNNLNTNVWQGNAEGCILSYGYATSSTSAIFLLPLLSFTQPASITVEGNFTVNNKLGSTVGSASSGDFSLNAGSSFKTAAVIVGGLSGLTEGDNTTLRTSAAASKITVNF